MLDQPLVDPINSLRLKNLETLSSTFQIGSYKHLQSQMLKDPLNFNLQQYCSIHSLFKGVKNWGLTKNKLKAAQIGAANWQLKNMPGFCYIDNALIEERLSSSELKLFRAWPGYQTIVNYLNCLVVYKGNRQENSRNILITGAPNCGKSALIWQRKPLSTRCSILQHCSIYPLGMQNWFPKYQSDVYHMVYWNQMDLRSYSYDTILKLLDGSPVDLPSKGGSSHKVDNPLVVMTSNLTLAQLVKQRFRSIKSPYQVEKILERLSTRIENVIVPLGYDLFILQKLLVKKLAL